MLEGQFYEGEDLAGVVGGGLAREEAGAGRSDEGLAGVGADAAVEVNDAWVGEGVPMPTLLALPSMPRMNRGPSCFINIISGPFL